MSAVYSTGTRPAGPAQFTVVTAMKVYRVRAHSEVAIRSVFTEVGIPVLGIDRDADDT